MILDKDSYPKLTPAQLENFRADIAKHPVSIKMDQRFGGGVQKAVDATCRLIEQGLLAYEIDADGHMTGETCVESTLSNAVGALVVAGMEDTARGLCMAAIAATRVPRRPN